LDRRVVAVVFVDIGWLCMFDFFGGGGWSIPKHLSY
jgi:hypothetical protein